MKLLHPKASIVLIGAATVLISGWVGLACSRRSPLAPDPLVKGSGTGIELADIIIVEQSEMDSIRASYVVSESQGDITGLATCPSGNADDACTAAARQNLREEAKKREIRLVVITSTSVRQTFPPQVALRATLHQITPR